MHYGNIVYNDKCNESIYKYLCSKCMTTYINDRLIAKCSKEFDRDKVFQRKAFDNHLHEHDLASGIRNASITVSLCMYAVLNSLRLAYRFQYAIC